NAAPGSTAGCIAISAPEQVIAFTASARLDWPEITRRESMSIAHEINIALSKNKAQSESISAAPHLFLSRCVSITDSAQSESDPGRSLFPNFSSHPSVR